MVVCVSFNYDKYAVSKILGKYTKFWKVHNFPTVKFQKLHKMTPFAENKYTNFKCKRSFINESNRNCKAYR